MSMLTQLDCSVFALVLYSELVALDLGLILSKINL